jgi:hypothetical protein
MTSIIEVTGYGDARNGKRKASICATPECAVENKRPLIYKGLVLPNRLSGSGVS